VLIGLVVLLALLNLDDARVDFAVDSVDIPLVFVILFLSSAFFPENLLMEPAQTIAEWNPMSLIADGLRHPIITGLSLDETLKGLGGIAIVAGIGTALCALGLRRHVRNA